MRKEKLIAKKMIKPQESKKTLTNGPLRGCQEYVVNKDELSKKYTDLKIKPLNSKEDSDLITNEDLEEIDDYLVTKAEDDNMNEDRKPEHKMEEHF